jgi:hypothetical protein
LLTLLAVIAPPSARAGQVRVSVGAGGNFFVPYQANLNLGDHVTWVWITNGHTVTDWNPPADSTNITFGGSIFDSDFGGTHFGQPSTTRFSWKSDRLGHVPCVPPTFRTCRGGSSSTTRTPTRFRSPTSGSVKSSTTSPAAST